MFAVIDLRRHLIGVAVMFALLLWMSNLTSSPYKVREVDATGARALMDAGALVIDVRGQEQFDARHIPGAILMTVEELRRGIPASLLSEAKGRNIVVYCGRGITRSAEGTALLNQAGFTSAVSLKGGIDGWANAGMPIQKG